MRTARIFEKTGMWVLLAILITVASSALIQWVALPSPPKTALAEKQAKFDSEQDSRFNSLIDQGTDAQNRGDYADALSAWQEAERSVPRLNEDQYTKLNKARLQTASAYESTDPTAAEGVYKTMADSAFRDGNAYFHSRDEIALERYQDAGKFADHLSEEKDKYLLMSNRAQVACLREMRRFPEAAAASQWAIDYFGARRDEYDPQIIDEYRELAQTYQAAQDWANLEQTISTAVGLCDKIVAHFSGMNASNDPTSTLFFTKDQMLYGLMDAYDRDGKPDQALSTAEDLFAFIEQNPQYADFTPYSRRNVANLALRIAIKANREDAANTWRERMNKIH